MTGSARRYPRTARVNEVMLEVLADELERMSDPRLELVTLTGVEVSRDLAHAKVFFSTLAASAIDGNEDGAAEEAAAGLRAAGSRLQGTVGRQMRIRQVPKLDFRLDPGIVNGQRIEAILRDIHHSDTETDEAGNAGKQESAGNEEEP